MLTIVTIFLFCLSFYFFICLIFIQFNRERSTHCFVCDDIINWDEDGGHIYANGLTTCPRCEAKYEEQDV